MNSGIPARDPIALTNGQISNIWLLFFERLYNLYVQTDASNSQALEEIRTIALSAKSIAEQAQLTNTTQAQQINDIVDQIAVLDDTKANKTDLQPIEDTANDAKALVLELQQDMLGLQSQINAILAKNYDTKIAQLSNQILTAVTQLADLYAVKADKVTQIIAGDGLTGGGDLSADRTITLGTPSTITSATTNSVSGTTHIHALDTTGVTAGTYGNSVQVASITFDDKGRATTASSVDIRVSTTSATGIVQLATNAEAQALTDAAKAITPATLAATTTSTNTASRIVIRDASGNFAAGTITAALIGNASTATTWQTARTITVGSTGKSVDGSANVTWSLAEIGAEASANKGVANGYASLDSGGKVPVAQLPSSIMEYKGTWNASTNTPTLSDGTGNTGDVYRVTVAGSQNLGSGSITYDVGDYAVHNGTAWEKSDTTDSVPTVFGRTGNVVAASGDYAATQITNTPAGNIAATTVQAALNELDSEKQVNLASSTSITLSGNQLQSAAKTGDVTAPANSNAMTIAANAVTLGKMASVATATVFYRKTAGTGDPEVQTLATLKTDLGLTGTNSGDQTITLTGDVTGAGTGSFAATIANDAVSNAKLANMPTMTIKGNNTGGNADPVDLTASQVRTLLNVADGATANTGTVTSVAMTVPTGLSITGSPITTSGTLAISYTAGYQGYTSTEASKLSGIATGAQVNVKADWNAVDTAAEILNKPTTLSGFGITNAYTKAEVDTTFAAYVGGRKAYTTLALAQADQVNLAVNTAIEVTNDPTASNNGTYQWDGTTLTKSAYDPLTQAKTYTDTAVNELGISSNENSDISIAIVDENYRRTWIEADNAGKPTTYAAGLIGEAVGVSETNDSNLSVAIVDSDNKRTWIEADNSGKPTTYAAGLIGEAVGFLEANFNKNIVCWGDSMTAGAGGGGTTYPNTLQTLLTNAGSSAQVKNAGVGGENSVTICARQGGNPLLVTVDSGSIPSATTATQITLALIDGQAARPLLQGNGTAGYGFVGKLAGVQGTIALVQPNGASTTWNNANYYTFTRSEAGSAVTVNRPTAFYLDFANLHLGDIHIIWIGQNGVSTTRSITDAKAMIQRMSALGKRYLVISKPTSSDADDSAFFAEFGRRFVAIRKYMIEYGLADAGITPTTQDTTDIANGVVPTSLRTDAVHWTAAGYTILANVIFKRLNELGWI